MRDASHYTRGRLSREAVHTLYGRSITLSASRMDKARSCHFAYFMQYGLRAKERTAAGFDAPQVGTFVHDVMEHTLRAASERGGLKALERPALHALVRQAIGAYIEKISPTLTGRTRASAIFSAGCASRSTASWIRRWRSFPTPISSRWPLSWASARTDSFPP
ncbi:MAG: PD-(D/E)XK nuclease family protein [Oscillospiraceae bacterium]